MKYDVIVIGAGPAGCMATITAAKRGLKVALLDGNNKIGRKLMITGKGRCNLTNDSSPENIIKNTIRNPRFLYSSVNRFPPSEVKAFFESAGVPLKTERGERVFPVSDRSADIVDSLFRQIKALATLMLGNKVLSVRKEGDLFCVQTEGETFSASSVVLATGGCSYSATGSTGDGYLFAGSFGHTINTPCPSLVPVCCTDRDIRFLQGLSLRHTILSLHQKGKKKPVFEDLGELLFTSNGITGPLALSASCHITGQPEEYSIFLDMKPGLSYEELDARILRDFSQFKNKNFSNSLSELLPASMIPVIIDRSNISPELKVNSITRTQRDALSKCIKEFSLTVGSLGRMEEAIVTRGGVDVRSVDPTTMESKLVPGLFFAGELLDCDAYTGGYNLQIAFSTGYAAGVHVGGQGKTTA